MRYWEEGGEGRAEGEYYLAYIIIEGE